MDDKDFFKQVLVFESFTINEKEELENILEEFCLVNSFTAKFHDVNSQALCMVTVIFKQGLQLPKDPTPTLSFQAKNIPS